MTSKKDSTRFEVKFEGIKLPKNIEQNIESEINQVVMKNLARVDFSKELGQEYAGIKFGFRPGIYPGKILQVISESEIPSVEAE